MKTLEELAMLLEFRLRSVNAREVGGWDFKERENLVVALFRLDCEPCSELLTDLAVTEQGNISIVLIPPEPLNPGSYAWASILARMC